MKRKIFASVAFMLILSVLLTSCLTDILAGAIFSASASSAENAVEATVYDDVVYEDVEGTEISYEPRNPTGKLTNLTKSDVENFIKNYGKIDRYLHPSEKDDVYITPTEEGFAKVLNQYGVSGDNCLLKYDMIHDCYSVLYEEILDEMDYVKPYLSKKGTAEDPFIEYRKLMAEVKKRTNSTDMAVVKPYRDQLNATIGQPRF
ncbi:MAG: hypothetical protein K5751_06430 [Treponemataceae bacterium]|nr:hypothetical protein [Treponemataceae bacterium]